MEFGEKLQELRKSRGLTQEALSEALYVSRTAVSKWESGRGYPSIDSLKEISSFFSVSIDDLLSGEKILSIAERESKSGVKRLCGQLFGAADLLSLLLIALPLYPKTVGNQVYSVPLLSYTETSRLNLALFWGMFLGMFAIGVVNLFLARRKAGVFAGLPVFCSMTLGTAAVLFLALAGETYAVVAAFLLIAVKTLLYAEFLKTGR